MDLVLGHDKTVADWAGQKFGVTIHPGYAAWGVINGAGELTGALIFFNFVRGGNVEFCAVGAVVRRGIMREVARYVFVQLKCTRLTALVARSNSRVQRMLIKTGFEYECTHKQHYGPTKKHDALVFVLSPERAQKWID